MLKIRPLNRDSLSDEDAPTIRKEAQEENALDIYNVALRLQYSGKYEEARALFQQLLHDNIPQLESQGGLPKTMSTLKYSCYVNLGNISKQNSDNESALAFYLQASELDSSDVTLWHKIGNLALQLNRFRQAAYAFSEGLQCNESHWPCLDKLITLLFAIRDTIGCLSYITKALTLDSDYVRGLVLRRAIYESNPATREYYQLFNPDYVLEPDLNVTIDETDRDMCMKEVQQLCDQINEVEKSFESKPLPCISLPKPLESFTWVSLGCTIIDLHQYISNNNMSHFCKVDLTKCMSQTGSVEEAVSEKANCENVVHTNETHDEEIEEKEVDDNPERRMSVTSEANGDVTDSGVENVTSSQAEDNDEMDQDTEDQEENVEQKVDKKRGTKRRRDLLLDLQIWGWHSKRKTIRKGKSEKDLTIEDALKRVIPARLLPNGFKLKKTTSCDNSVNTDLCKLLINKVSDDKIMVLDLVNFSEKDLYFGSQNEKDDVLKFWTKKWECCDAVSLVEEFIKMMAVRWYQKWPSNLIPIYVQLYEMYREHFDHPQLYGSTATFDELKADALATLLYGELLFYQNNLKDCKVVDGISPMSLGFLQLLTTWEKYWEDDFAIFYIRVHWLRAHIFRKNNENSLAVRFLQLVQEMIADEEQKINGKFQINFYNYEKYAVITSDITVKLLQHLEMIESLSHLEQLYNLRSYREVVEILKATFLCVGAPPTFGRMGRSAQLGMLMDSLWFLNKDECFIWTEKCFNEAVDHFLVPKKHHDKWELVLKKCLEMMHEIIKLETVIVFDVLDEEYRYRLIENLCKTVCCQLNSDEVIIPLGTIIPWLIMHFVLLREEHREQAQKRVSHVKKKRKISVTEDISEINEKQIPSSISILFSAHDFLGRRGWCLTAQGELLHFIIDTILDRLDTPIFEPLRDRIDIHLEQAFFCLYQHPSKKNKVSRHLADHNVNPLPLLWERAQQLYEFYCPDVLPEFDSYKSLSVLSDVEQLLQRIIVLVPSECDPQPLMDKISEFVNGNSEELPIPMAFPNKIRAAYYLLGDYYFKQNEITRSVKYFLLDICINPLRLDTWADLALGIASQIENKLNHCERFKTDNEFFDKCKSACVCFKRALYIMPNHITLWIEYGAFEYMAHSFCSRLLKYDSDTFSIEKFEILENKKESYLDSAGNSFQKALDLYRPEQTEADERWLHNYMLGKVAEKRRKEPVEYLQHYLTAAALLSENNATYPDKINYHNPQHLSIEALEIHYRIHASILKYLELHEGKNITSTIGKMFKKCLDTCKLYETTLQFSEDLEKAIKDDTTEICKCVEDLINEVVNREKEEKKTSAPDNPQDVMDALMRETMSKETPIDTDSDGTNIDEGKFENDKDLRKSIDETTTSSTSSDSSDSDSESDSSSSSSSSSSSDSSTYLSDSDINNLVDRCVVGLEQCMIRFPQNYKALYRLVHLYFYYKAKKDVGKCKQLLLSEYKCKNNAIVSGLFADHKNNNFFNGVWRIPSSEIDRPGSLAAHMARCVTILLQVLRRGNDHKTLLDVCLQLRRVPDADKVYIRHNERDQLCEQALSLCVQSLREQIKTIVGSSGIQKLLIDIFRSYQRIQKHIPTKESAFSMMLCDIYKKTMKDNPPDNINVLDLAIKYCQQHKAVEKLKQQQLKQQQQQIVAPPTVPIISGAPPVLPTPSNISSTTVPLKRPTLGRPRGRPPGPKQPAISRTSRGRGFSHPSNLAWQKMMYDQKSMKYMLEYQEELLRQYNALSKMTYQTQFPQFTLPNSQPSLPNANQLTQMLSQMLPSTMNNLTSNQFTQGLSNFNPAMFQKLVEQCASTFNQNMIGTTFTRTTATPGTSQTKPTYTTAGLNKNLPTSTFKYANDLPKKSVENSDVQDRKLQSDFKAAASMFMERPNITITPVTQTNLPIPKQPVSTGGKTLQEKLADKQKQHTNKNLSFEKGKRLQSTTYSSPSSIAHANLTTFPLEPGVSISQVPSQVKSSTTDKQERVSGKVLKKSTDSSATNLNLPPNLPLAISVIKKPEIREERKVSSDDDVIIIE